MRAHTPGPWRVGDEGFTVFGPKTDAPSPVTVANVKRKPDATLIAAAPMLAEALRAIALALDGKRNRFGKLEGYTTEREPLRLLAVHYGTPGASDNIDQAVHVARAALKAAGL